MARHKKHHQKTDEIEDRLTVTGVPENRTMITWFRKDGSHSSVVIPDKAIAHLVRRLASWMDL